MLGPALAFDEEGVGDDEEAADEDMSWWVWGARYGMWYGTAGYGDVECLCEMRW